MYQVDFTPGAESDLSRLDAPIAQRVLKRLRWLAENFEAIRPEPLTGNGKVCSNCVWVVIEYSTLMSERSARL